VNLGVDIIQGVKFAFFRGFGGGGGGGGKLPQILEKLMKFRGLFRISMIFIEFL
jgi:hypothetical protein